jgi:hypothetical protein
MTTVAIQFSSLTDVLKSQLQANTDKKNTVKCAIKRKQKLAWEREIYFDSKGKEYL